MKHPDTRYARSGDLMIAFQVTGEEHAVDIVCAPGVASHLDLDWDSPAEAWFLERLGSFSRLIRFDKRGTGLSDRNIGGAATLEERTDDIRAVMDAADSNQAVLFGISEGGCMACLFAATYPERTRGLMLWGTQARWVQSEDYPWGFPRDDHARMIAEMAEHGMTREYLTGAGAGMTDLDASEFDWLMRYFRAAASPTQLAALEQMNRDMDIRAILPSIRVPTLVMNRSDDPVVPIEAARALASGISTARLLEIPGSTHAWYGPGQDEIIAAMQEFVTGEPPAPRIDRVLATVLFTDIVGSTTKASELGDDRWRAVLAAHDARAKAELARHGGTYVHTTGDGLLATFDGPTRAVLCAQAIANAMRPLGIQIRAGCHTGELELAGNDVQGIAVHIAARIAALAGAGEVLVSRTVRELSAGSPITFDDRGSEHLKGVSEAWQLYAVRDD